MVGALGDRPDFVHKIQALGKISEFKSLVESFAINLPAISRTEAAFDLLGRHFFAFHSFFALLATRIYFSF